MHPPLLKEILLMFPDPSSYDPENQLFGWKKYDIAQERIEKAYDHSVQPVKYTENLIINIADDRIERDSRKDQWYEDGKTLVSAYLPIVINEDKRYDYQYPRY